MKVALYNLTTTTQYGGVESFVWQVARNLAARGIDITIVGGNGSIRHAYPSVRVVTFPFTSRATLRRVPGLAKQYTLTKLVERLSFGLRARAFMARERFDIIHIQKPYDLPAAAWFKRNTPSKIVFGCHGTDFFPTDRRFVNASDIAVSCSAFNADQVRAHYGISPRVVYNGIDPQQFFPQTPDAEWRSRVIGDANALTMFYAGRLVRWKGVQYLIDALALLAQTRNVQLLIAGEGEYRHELEQRAREQGIADCVQFLGYIPSDALPSYYAIADVVALASYANETFSIMSAEAMACARPVIGTRFGGIPEVIADGETGFLAEPENANDLAEKLGRLLDDAALRERFGQCGRQRVLKLFTWDTVTERVLDAYKIVLNESPAR
ncbi:MAG TPA: glycosyltransferase family 4 protein [Anaerolineae bacterium]|nr:glycosyltransferase family 4 protein [Anaerolineae bacterium]